PYDHGGQDLLGQVVIMPPQPALQMWTPESRHIHTQHPIPFIPSHTPLILTGHIALPDVQQLVDIPNAITQGTPTAPHTRSIQSALHQRSKDGTSTLQK